MKQKRIQHFLRPVVLSLLFVALALPVAAADFFVDDIFYNVLDGKAKTCEVTQSPYKYSGDIVVPSTVVYKNETYSVTAIGNMAMLNCEDVKTLHLSEGITTIGDQAFYFCKNLTSIVLPKSVASIGWQAFWGCSELSSIVVHEENPNFKSFLGLLYSEKGTKLLVVPNGKKSITISEKTLAIDADAFSGCTELLSINSLLKTPINLPDNVFSSIDKEVCKLYVPIGSKSAYENNKQWNVFAEIIETDSKVDIELESATDQIDYKREISQEELTEAINAMKTYFNQSLTGQYCLRGAKEGNVPQSHAYQRQYGLGTDGYAQYAVVPHKDFAYGTLTSTYNVSKEFNSDPHASYTMVKNALVPILVHPMVDNVPEMKALNLLFLSLAAQERCDLSGPFTFFEDKQGAETPKNYNGVRAIYMNIEQCLRTIVDCLEYYEQRPDWYKKEVYKLLKRYMQSAYEMLYGEYTMRPYIKLANSLKLRMAMNMVKVEPELARQWAEEAVAAGVVEDVKDQTGIFPMFSGFSHPLIDISESWGDWRLSASFESLLMSLNHPYAKEGFLFEKNGVINGYDGSVLEAGEKIVGIRGGTLVGDGQTNPPNQRVNYSRINKRNFQMTPLYYIKWSEVDFLRAEGAIRGWDMGGTAQDFYERGIRNGSFEDPMFTAGIYEAAVTNYLNQAEAVPYVQKDPLKDAMGGDVSDWPSVTKIGVKWNDGDSQETKLEKIITQKYIALFPNSWQAWTDLRRTGYPKLFPVLNTDDGDGSIQQGEMIRRIPWVATDPQEIANINATGIPALGGPDLQATRLWWDADCGNFESVNSIDRATADEAGEVWLDNGHLYFSGAETVRIYSADGKLIKTAENAQSVSVADFATGVYLVTVTGNGHTATVKVAIK